MVKGGLDWLVNLGCSFHKTRGWRTGSQRSAEVRLGSEPVSQGNAVRMEPEQPQIASGPTGSYTGEAYMTSSLT